MIPVGLIVLYGAVVSALPAIVGNGPIETITPPDLAARLLANDGEDLMLMFTGDTQYHFPCTNSNKPCKDVSESFRAKNRLGRNCELDDRRGLAALQVQDVQEQCAILEGNFANEVQRKAIFDLARKLPQRPKALIINGDLTNFGHSHQLELFRNDWLTMPFPVFVGLGNHDYQNNVNDCVANQCANNMLAWFTNSYAPLMNLTLDMERKGGIFKASYEGSFAYAKDFCSDRGSSCVHSVQLHNRPDYVNNVNSVNTWRIRSSLQWLRYDLDNLTNKTWPVLINLHNHEFGPSSGRLRRELESWLASEDNDSILRRVIVLFAHFHEKHSLTIECISGVTVPFLYVGSVPRNRYTLIKFKSTAVADMFFMNANPDGTNTIVAMREFQWRPC